MVDKKEKKFLIDNPILMAEWNWEKNDGLGLNPEILTLGSGKKAWWKCSKGHEWTATIASRNSGHACPYCSGKYAIKGENDLQTLNPKLANEWNYEKNDNLKPEDVMTNSGKKVWWKCVKGHEWQATIDHRNKGTDCPYCSSNKVLIGYNDLATINPKLAIEWNYEKNGNLKPEDFTSNSGKKVWWKCLKGHEWQTTINKRNNGNNCPVCNSESNTSLPEFVILYYLEKHGLKTIHAYKERGYELDVYIPSKKIAIEYDGYFYHKNKIKKDLEKNFKCKQDGIKLYRVREGLPILNDYSIDYTIDKNQKDLGEVVQQVLIEIAGKPVDIDLQRDNIEIENLRKYTKKSNSLLFSNPTLAKEWNYKKNGNLKPEHFMSNSKKKVWWKCRNGHEWQSVIQSRSNGTGCPYCSGRFAIKGENDLVTINSKLASDWNYEKNGVLKPENFMPNSNTKVWWKCEKGHEWEAKIQNRNNGRGCPYCSGRKK